MARFNDIHRSALNAAAGRLRLGELWNVELREPLQFVGPDTAPADAFVTVVSFVAARNGRLEPAGTKDREIIADWEKRHRDTPDDQFGLPGGLF
jgi:hypothetical protein